ncbi:excinuclease ABC subunit UvrC [Zongyangia hominis]|uniref:UvrABC system protein C n=1 Tax=Zongyangia hominis TaxID=2763677 RepID=A0A926EAB7_9FIRM|nr:excinuclease ABC subunit UvrC [Zongyangia hominis]MBC8570118.1 excinuclease ABC subunit UvrC [Zongyangia hominis]
MQDEILERLKKKVSGLPLAPGVYMMKDKTGHIIYVGKAKALKNRVSSYFRAIENHHPKVYQMVQNVYDFDYIVVDSEYEALVLECSLIKQHAPKYNILLKDDKGYHYIKVEKKPWGRISEVKQFLNDGDEYIGPYVSGFIVKQMVDETNKAFKLPTCSRRFPAEIGKGRPCLNRHIDLCIAPCTGRVSEAEYGEILAQAVDFIKGGSENSLKSLRKMMEEAAEALDFERAARLRDRIKAIEKISEHQKVVLSKVPEQDVIALSQLGRTVCAVVLKFRGSKLIDKKDFLLGEVESIDSARSEFLMRYYDTGGDIPPQIELDAPCEDQDLFEEYLTEKAGRRVHIHVPQRGEQHDLVLMAKENASQRLSHETARTGREIAALDELARLLGLPHPPHYIEAYDISNIGESTIVGGMVVFEEGRPLKQAYRKFAIKEQQGPDDYAAMTEVITRRLSRYREGDPHFSVLPDLILLDGGKGHVSTILPVVRAMGFDIPVFGMVKDDRHRTRAIAVDGGEISINSNRSAFSLVTAIQDEVHRFSIRYSRQKHQSGGFQLMLTRCEGIGQTRAVALLKHFKTVKAIRAATVEELCEVKGMTRTAAENLHAFLQEN